MRLFYPIPQPFQLFDSKNLALGVVALGGPFSPHLPTIFRFPLAKIVTREQQLQAYLFRLISQLVSAFSTTKTLLWEQQLQVGFFRLIFLPVSAALTAKLYQVRHWYRWSFPASYLYRFSCFARKNRTEGADAVRVSISPHISIFFLALHAKIVPSKQQLQVGLFPSHISTCFCCLDFKNRTVEAATAGLPHITTYSYGLIYDEIQEVCCNVEKLLQTGFYFHDFKCKICTMGAVVVGGSLRFCGHYKGFCCSCGSKNKRIVAIVLALTSFVVVEEKVWMEC